MPAQWQSSSEYSFLKTGLLLTQAMLVMNSLKMLNFPKKWNSMKILVLHLHGLILKMKLRKEEKIILEEQDASQMKRTLIIQSKFQTEFTTDFGILI